MSDHHHLVDYSDATRVSEVFAGFGYDAIVAGCNDFAAFSTAITGELHGLSYTETLVNTEIIHNKARFRELCGTLGVDSPKAVSLTEGEIREWTGDGFRFPVLVKPVDLTGGKGIVKCSQMSELSRAVEAASRVSRRNEFVVEEFIGGPLRSACFFVKNRNPLLLTHADEFSYLNEFLVASALVPSLTTESRLTEMSETVARICRHLNLSDGLLHLQYVATENTDYLIEMCRRPPGDLYLHLPTRFHGISISEIIVKDALGLPFHLGEPIEAIPPTLRLCLMAETEGEVCSWDVSPKLSPLVIERCDLRPQKTRITNHMIEKLGIVFAVSERRGSLEAFASLPGEGVTVKYS